MAPQDSPDRSDRQLEEINEQMTPARGFRFYHLRTLLWTYLVWAALNVFFASQFCHVFNGPLTWIPYYWALFHILPLMLFLPNEIQSFGVDLPVCVALSVLLLVSGLFIKERWAHFLIIIGMSIWFLVGFAALGVGA